MDDAHEELLAKWANEPHHLKNGAFIQDGIIDPDRWVKAPRKLLFINKEAYDGDEPDRDGLDLRGLIRDVWHGARAKTYETVSHWAYGLNSASSDLPSQFPPWNKVPTDCSEDLLSAAVMNIKKSAGKRNSDSKDLAFYATTDGSHIRNQVDIINPDIVVCGHVWYLIKYLWPDAHPLYDCVFSAGGRTFIDFWHPANRSDDQMKYYALAALVQNSDALGRYRTKAVCAPV